MFPLAPVLLDTKQYLYKLLLASFCERLHNHQKNITATQEKMLETRPGERDRTVIFFDVLFTVLTFLFAFWLRNNYLPKGDIDLYSHLFLIPLLLALLLNFLSYFGAYSSPHRSSLTQYAYAIFRGLTFTLGILLSLLFLLNIQYVSRFVVIIFSFIDFIFLLFIRFIVIEYFKRSVKSGINSLKILIIGTGERAKELARELKKQSVWGVEIIGYLDPDPKCIGIKIDNVPVIGSIENVSECLKKNVIDEVIIAIPRSLLEDAEPIAHACEEEGITLKFMADVFSVKVARVSLTTIGSIPLLTMEAVALDDNKLFIKRVVDLTLTSLAMPLVLPIMAIAAIAIKLDSPGRVFFIQERVGLRKHIFPMFKFRSMHTDAEEKLKEIEHLNEAEGPIFKIANDPRITRVGKFIRKTSIDELPQLFNVLRGEMSLVGPRPMSIRDVNLFDKGIQRKRFSVKPGITCIWQISGRSNLPFHQWLEMDLEYINNWSIFLDFKILLKTIPAVMTTKGAT